MCPGAFFPALLHHSLKKADCILNIVNMCQNHPGLIHLFEHYFFSWIWIVQKLHHNIMPMIFQCCTPPWNVESMSAWPPAFSLLSASLLRDSKWDFIFFIFDRPSRSWLQSYFVFFFYSRTLVKCSCYNFSKSQQSQLNPQTHL